MSRRPPIVIGATLRGRGQAKARSRRHKRSAPCVAAHRRRMRDGLGVFQVELSWQALRAALEAAGHLEGDKGYNDNSCATPFRSSWRTGLLTVRVGERASRFLRFDPGGHSSPALTI
jgi:hypothetical protein